MSRTLSAPGNHPRILAPTTTVMLARRMLAASRVAADRLPRGFHGSAGLDILLALFIAEHGAHYPDARELMPPGSASPRATDRWIDAAVQLGYVDRRGDVLALTDAGYDVVEELIEAMYAAQRALD